LIRTGTLGMPGRVEVLSGVQVGETVLLRSSAHQTSSDPPQDSTSKFELPVPVQGDQTRQQEPGKQGNWP